MSMEEVGPIESGRIKWYSVPKQFGFITRDTGGDVFLHHRSIVFDGVDCDHGKDICGRALALLPPGTAGPHTSVQAIERALVNVPVKFRVRATERRPEAHAVKRA
jgi:cold shock CspA family protein